MAYFDNRVPPELQPLSPWKYFGLSVLYSIPVVGWIFLICHAIGSFNINKKNYARSFLCIYVLLIILSFISSLLGIGSLFAAVN